MYFEGDKNEICSLVRLYKVGGFTIRGENSWTEQGDDIEDWCGEGPPPVQSSFGKFRQDLRGLSKKWDQKVKSDPYDWDSCYSKFLPKMVIECVTATPGQEEAEDYLQRLGFQKIGPVSKMKHEETSLTFWVINGEEFCNAIGYVCEYDPRNKEAA